MPASHSTAGAAVARLPTTRVPANRGSQRVGRPGAAGGDSWLSSLLNLPNGLLHCFRRNTRVGSRRNIRPHYDLSNAFFALFLEPSMTYSSAVFESADESLETAQRRKFDGLVRHLDLEPAHHVLEIGCGWGALAIRLARTRGCRVTGITVSREQHDPTGRRAALNGSGARRPRGAGGPTRPARGVPVPGSRVPPRGRPRSRCGRGGAGGRLPDRSTGGGGTV